METNEGAVLSLLLLHRRHEVTEGGGGTDSFAFHLQSLERAIQANLLYNAQPLSNKVGGSESDRAEIESCCGLLKTVMLRTSEETLATALEELGGEQEALRGCEEAELCRAVAGDLSILNDSVLALQLLARLASSATRATAPLPDLLADLGWDCPKPLEPLAFAQLRDAWTTLCLRQALQRRKQTIQVALSSSHLRR